MENRSSAYKVVPALVLTVVISALIGSVPVFALDPVPTIDSSSLKSNPEVSSTVRVRDAYRLGHADENDPLRNNAAIGDVIIIKVEALSKLIYQSKCLDLNEKKVQDCEEHEIALYLDGREIKGVIPESGAPQLEEQTLQFHLQRSIDSNEAWADLLGAPPMGNQFFKRNTAVSVGLEDGYAELSVVKGAMFQLIRVHEWRFYIWSIGLVFLLFYFFRLSMKSDILRDFGSQPENGRRKPYSLARTQMAVWFFLVIASFLYIWLITGAYDTVTETALALVGIGAGTALGAAVIDVNKNQEIATQLMRLKAEKPVLEKEVATLNTQIAATPQASNASALQQARETKQTRLNLAADQIEELSTNNPRVSQSFMKDILSDTSGVSFHRVQISVWTIVLSILFIYSVWNRLSMPEFSATLLALLGISSGTYIGFKIPEK